MSSLKHIKLHYLPAITCCWFIITFALTYFIAVFYEHVYPILPYISETGAKPPESCIFGEMLNLGAILLASNNYIRYRQIHFAIESGNIVLKKVWIEAALWCGYVVCFGITLVGNFQQNSVLYIHLIGAFIAFGGTVIFFILQTRISFALRDFYAMYPKYGVGNNILYFRVIATACYVLFFVTLCVFSFVSAEEFTGNDYTWWTKEHGGYYTHLLSTFSEWFLVITLILYILSVSKEFKALEFREVTFINKNIETDCVECTS